MRATPFPPHAVPIPPYLLAQFEPARREYRDRFKLELSLVDLRGKLLRGKQNRRDRMTEKALAQWRALAVTEALRWGQPSMVACPGDRVMWGAPVMANNQVVGGVVVPPCVIDDRDENLRTTAEAHSQACAGLLEIAEKYNLTNSALLKLNRLAAFVEREKAEAIHETKKSNYNDLQKLYHREEPLLLHAIQEGEPTQARASINRLLLHIYNHRPLRLNPLKSFAMELIVMMSRTAVDAGADPTRIMGMNSERFAALAGIDDEEELSGWLRSTLERLMSEIHAQRRELARVHLARAESYIERHLSEKIRRSEVARHCGLSSSHFSHLVRNVTGQTFRELVARHRVRQASHLLARTNRSLAEIALDCGFADQSYFTKIFRRIAGQNPLQYRKSLGQAATVT
ncbi:MAG: AraC family transcriptional regulator [Methylacidiphilales bacterium]|nr:AraC family transcriptional regulator [Candidatus Methylacidiphilales bacterium]